ncbi:hypothetical protein QYM36_002698 [Artemia franciscana]|uniref:Ubiquinone biosynthesis protein n=2 Tax=Artemia franciscana TaxID=6661 RepID=A0AA88LDF4_ARTSF|nr:hypothetical protein QYM36_002698 [Artemia franciscana]
MYSLLPRRFLSSAETTRIYEDEFEAARKEEEKRKFEDEDYEVEIRKKILEASLPYVHEKGWSKEALGSGAEEIGYPSTVHGLFPREGLDLALYFYEKCNNNLEPILEDRAKNENLEKLDFFQKSIEDRLRMNIEYIDRWHEALGLFALPQNYPMSIKRLMNLMDDIMHYSGDRSSDVSWYVKRISLGGIYKATELYMLQDYSDDYKNTWLFLQRRLEDGKRLSDCARLGMKAGDYMESTFVTVRNMLGMRQR